MCSAAGTGEEPCHLCVQGLMALFQQNEWTGVCCANSTLKENSVRDSMLAQLQYNMNRREMYAAAAIEAGLSVDKNDSFYDIKHKLETLEPGNDLLGVSSV